MVLILLILVAGVFFPPADCSCVLGLHTALVSFLNKDDDRPLKVILSSNSDACGLSEDYTR